MKKQEILHLNNMINIEEKFIAGINEIKMQNILNLMILRIKI